MADDYVKQSVVEANTNYFAYGDNPTLRWRDVELQAKCHPRHEALALGWIRRLLGYLPEQHAYMPSMAMLQASVESFKSQRISKAEFLKDLVFLCRKIRSEDMRRGGWIQHKAYDESDYSRYYNHLPIYKQPARERLCIFTQSEPSLDHSLGAEIFLRQLFMQDSFYNNMPFGETDYKAATIVEYRKTFLTLGEKAADNAKLLAFDATL